MTGEAFIGEAMRMPIGRYARTWLVATAVRELALRRARRALCTRCVGMRPGISAVTECV